MWYRLRTINKNSRTKLMRLVNDIFNRINRSQRIGNMIYRHDFCFI